MADAAVSPGGDALESDKQSTHSNEEAAPTNEKIAIARDAK